MPLDLNLLLALGGFAVAALGLIATGWWRITTMIKEARAESAEMAASAGAEAAAVRKELAEHKLHVAESYVSNSAFVRVTDQIMEAIKGVKDSVDQVRARIDNAFDKPVTAA